MNALLKMILRIPSTLYGAGVRLRNGAYDAGIFTIHGIDVPVIAVGNLTAGGTGKTPTVEMLLGELRHSERKVAVISRGYRRKSTGTVVVSDGAGRIAGAEEGGDEPVQIAGKFPAVPVVVDERRVRGCRHAVRHLGAELLILDDAFQHRACRRDVDILVIDASRDMVREMLLPAGRLREPPSGMRRADLVILTRCEEGNDHSELRRWISSFTSAPILLSTYLPDSIRSLDHGEAFQPEEMRGAGVFSFCGIGNPDSFSRTLDLMGCIPRGSIRFRDHHDYGISDIDRILAAFGSSGASYLITTEKDAVRLARHRERFSGVRPVYLEMRMRLSSDHAPLRELLETKILNRI